MFQKACPKIPVEWQTRQQGSVIGAISERKMKRGGWTSYHGEDHSQDTNERPA